MAGFSFEVFSKVYSAIAAAASPRVLTLLLADFGFGAEGVASFEEFGAGEDDSRAELEVEFLSVLDATGQQVVGDQVERRNLVPRAAEFYVVRLHFVAVAADRHFLGSVPGEVERGRRVADLAITDRDQCSGWFGANGRSAMDATRSDGEHAEGEHRCCQFANSIIRESRLCGRVSTGRVWS